MALTDRERQLLMLLERCLDLLKGEIDVDASQLEPFGDEETLVQRRLQIAVQCAIDIGDSVVAKLGLPEPPQMRDVFGTLARHKVIATSLVRPLERATGFRNALVHAYVDLSPVDTWRMLRESYPALVSFAAAIEQQK